MAGWTTFANLPEGLNPFTLFDQQYLYGFQAAVCPCTATGTNAITIVRANANTPQLTALVDGELFSFRATATTTSSVVTVTFGSVASPPMLGPYSLVLADGATNPGVGAIVNGGFYVVAWSAGLGKFMLVSAAGASAFGTQAANTVFAGPTSGAAALPAFRALVGADLPTPQAAVLGGTFSYAAVAHQFITSITTAGQPVSAQPDGSDVVGYPLTETNDTNVTLTLGGSASTALLRAASLTLGWTGQLGVTRGGTGLGSFNLGDTLYASAANTLSALAGNITSTRKFLRQTGTGAVSAAPVWDTIVAADVPASALTSSNDTNVTITLGGSPNTALLAAASLTMGWTGQLAGSRGGTGVNNASTITVGGNFVTAGAVSLPSIAQGDLWYGSAAGVISALAKSTGTSNFLKNSGTSNNPAWAQPALSDLANIAASSLVGNTTTGSGAVAAFTIGSLTQKASPGANDLVILQDQAASGQLKYATVSSVASAGSVSSLNGQTGAIVLKYVAGGRLTLGSGTPVMNSTTSGATTVYYTPYVHDSILIYDGTNFVPTTFTEISQATTDTTKSPAAVANNSNYDIFVWNDSGTIRATRGPAWSSDTSRGTGAGTTQLTRQNGVWLNTNAITNGPGALRGTYVGTIRSNGSAQIDYTFGASGTAARFAVWNQYNRVPVSTSVQDSTASWTYTSSTIRQANASAVNQCSFVRGQDEDGVEAKYDALASANNTATAGTVGFGLDSTTAYSGNSTLGYLTASIVNFAFAGSCSYAGLPGLGYHVLSANEADNTNTNTVTFYGSSAPTYRSGQTYKLLA